MTSDRRPRDAMSHVLGDTHDPLRTETIPGLLAHAVAEFGQNEAAVFPAQEIRWTYSELAHQVDRLAGGLLDLGVARGDRVGIWSPNRIEWLLTQFATARIGAILVCINPAYRLYELEYALNKVGCNTLVLAPLFKSSNYIEMIQELAPELASAPPGDLRAARLPHLRNVIAMGSDTPFGMIGFDALCTKGDQVARSRLDEITRSLSQTDPINIQFTSGTTGSPKGACLTHRNIVNNAHFVTKTMRFSDRDRLCIPVPFYHCFGMVMGTLGCVSKGATMVVPGEGFDAAQTLTAVSEEKCTALYGVPTMFVSELALDDFHRFDLTHLRTGIMAGAPCPIEVMKRVQAEMNMSEVTIAYGMTETSPVSFQSNVDDPLDKRVSSVGRIHPHVECKVIDAEGQTVLVDVQGELVTRGYSVMQGYWDEPGKTSESIDVEGWMHTGDLAVIDRDGYCTITGRVKDMILRGGENIYPKEVEDFLFTHPDIALAQVFGIPDGALGEVVCAWIVAREGASLSEEEVRDFCRERIAHYKIPLHVRIKADLPMTVTGKPQKFRMRKEMERELNIG
ncbi:AMP-binding protein [Thalassococcus sp. S3]|uniref:AMP-binding protein n=1 Tax=Thalassococcus sp. S3 TaxID=2017482 RepID=UPI001023F541|nr:AMP-binding protein [Thalassococcus sp. S3]QBF31662.1 AMP-binding protein [Thalassococcus sp. S3]